MMILVINILFVVISYFDSNFDKNRPIKKRISYAITMIFTKLPSLPNLVIIIDIASRCRKVLW